MTASVAARRAASSGIELRFTEVRATSTASGKPRIEGYAATFNNPAELPGFREVIKPGAFTRAIDEQQPCLCLWNHNSDNILGSVASGTLQLDQDSRGLHYTCELPDTQAGRDAHTIIKRGDVNGCSFGFTVDPDGQDWSQATDEKGVAYALRSIKSVTRLLDVSPVAYPAYGGTKVTARSAVQPPMELRSAVIAHNRGFKMPTFDECLEITRRAEQRKQDEIRHRRQNLLHQILS